MVIASRRGCHLCQDAEAVAARVCQAGAWAALDVDQHPALQRMFTAHVPVVWVDGRLLTYWTLTDEQLSSALRTGRWPAPAHL